MAQGARAMTQMVKCLPHKLEDLSLDPRYLCDEAGALALGLKTGGSLGLIGLLAWLTVKWWV